LTAPLLVLAQKFAWAMQVEWTLQESGVPHLAEQQPTETQVVCSFPTAAAGVALCRECQLQKRNSECEQEVLRKQALKWHAAILNYMLK
jgi:hypothetical protein